MDGKEKKFNVSSLIITYLQISLSVMFWTYEQTLGLVIGIIFLWQVYFKNYINSSSYARYHVWSAQIYFFLKLVPCRICKNCTCAEHFQHEWLLVELSMDSLLFLQEDVWNQTGSRFSDLDHKYEEHHSYRKASYDKVYLYWIPDLELNT